MEKGKGQGRSSLGAKAAGSGVGYGTKGPRTSRRFFFWGCEPLDLANTASYSFRYRDIFFFPGIDWVISSHAANIPCFVLFFPRGQEAHQQRALRDSTVFFCTLLGGQLTRRGIRFARPAGGRHAYLV